jgi:ammonia channel protein AmtB
MLAIMAWTAALSGIYFLTIMKLGHFRIDKSVEVIGLDIAEMGGLSSNLIDKIL